MPITRFSRFWWMRIPPWGIGLGLVGVLDLVSCVHSDDVPDYVVMEANTAEVEDSAAVQQIRIQKEAPTYQSDFQNFETFIAEHPEGREILQDVEWILKARAWQEAQDPRAMDAWQKAAESTQGRMAKLAFEGWLTAFVLQQGPELGDVELARRVLQASDQGRRFPYMTAAKLGNHLALTRLIRSLNLATINDQRTATSLKLNPSSNRDSLIVKQPIHAWLKSDPLLKTLSKRICSDLDTYQKEQKRIIKMLDSVQGEYFAALVQECSGRGFEASLQAYQTVIPRLRSHSKYASMALHAASKYAALSRASGDRAQTAQGYAALFDAWSADGIRASDFGDSKVDFLVRRIDDSLWAARFVSLAGNIQSGEVMALKALDLIDDPTHRSLFATSAYQAKAMELGAEALHVLAFRIYVEQKDWPKAVMVTRQGRKLPMLSKQWQERFWWYEGFYLMLDGQVDVAFQVWRSFLQSTTSDGYREKLLFWLARLGIRLNQNQLAQDYLDELLSQHPLSFYSVVGKDFANLPLRGSWMNGYPNPRAMLDKYEGQRRFDLNLIRRGRDSHLLLARAEMLLGAGIGDLGQIAAQEFEAYVRKSIVAARHPKPFMYAARLLNRGGDHFRSIGLTSDIASAYRNFWQEYPEHIIAYYPRPFKEEMAQASRVTGVNQHLIYAIARQESSFRAAVQSPAGAMGLLQLLPSTAARIAQSKGYFDPELLNLNEPFQNALLGAAYLADLGSRYDDFIPAVMGAYNAGEFAVDAWIKRRHHPDPLVWCELVPFQETNNYIKKVWRNMTIYRYLDPQSEVVL